MAQRGRRPPSSSSSDSEEDEVAQQQCFRRQATSSLTELTPEATTETSRQVLANVQLTASSDDDLSETDIEDMLESQEEVVSFAIEVQQKKIAVGLLAETTHTRSRIGRLFDNTFTVTFFQGRRATVQHSTAHILRTDHGTHASAGVIVYDTPHIQPHQQQGTSQPVEEVIVVRKKEESTQKIEEDPRVKDACVPIACSAQATKEFVSQGPTVIPPSPPVSADEQVSEDPVPVPTENRVYVSTVAHIWSSGCSQDGVVRCRGRMKLSDGTPIAQCTFPEKQCNHINPTLDQTSMLCTITNGTVPPMIQSVSALPKGIDTCLIPLQHDLPIAMQMLQLKEVSPVVIEDLWVKNTPVFAVYGQYAAPGSEALHVLKAIISEPRYGQKTDLGCYKRIIEYKLESPGMYTTQGGDCGCPLFTVVAGQVKLLGFHVAADERTAFCYALPANSNLKAFPTPAGYDRKICIPATLKANLQIAS